MNHTERSPVAGVDPHLVIVLDLTESVDLAEFRRAGLTVLDGSDARVVIAFADDPQLAGFVERLDAFDAGPPEGQKSEPYAGFLDAIAGVRSINAEERINPDLISHLAQIDMDSSLRLDVELWHPGDPDVAAQWTQEFIEAVSSVNGETKDVYRDDDAGLILARIYVPAGGVGDLAQVDTVASLNLLPSPYLSVEDLHTLDEDALPPVEPALGTSPIVGLVDSGVASAHPLISAGLVTTDALSSGIEDGEDRNGHGTMVAGLLMYGRIDRAISLGLPMRPLCRVVSAAVLNAEGKFSTEDLWESDVSRAIAWCADQGARIINLSIGDSRAPLLSERQTPVAAIVDQLIRRRDLIVFISAGNSRPADYLAEVSVDALNDYPTQLLDDPNSRVLDPGTSSLSLTVGGITESEAATGMASREVASRRPFGKPGWPSPITRVGPGLSGAVKPELVELAGTLGLESGTIVSNDAELGVISTLSKGPKLLGFRPGTSFAAPLAARVAAGIRSRFPDFSGELVRALVLLSSVPTEFEGELTAETKAAAEAATLNLIGFGRPSMARAIESTDHRATLISDSSISINGVHVYEIPIPTSFFQSGGVRGIDVALAFSPRTRIGRLDYMSSRMEFYVTRDISLAEVADIFAKLDSGEIDSAVFDDTANEDEEQQGTDESAEPKPSGPSGLGRRLLSLKPSKTTRARGANQLGRAVFKTKWRESDSPAYLVVRNVNRWDDETSSQTFAVAVTVWRSEESPAIHAELRGRLEAVAEVEVEAEIE